ncbi:hypothetical protein L1987_49391 [Smallanthus sonchifolius]|uniref:Uncharacterized protein n=1 Tax=Smallanthus sonchifolius TaxID=185202 RepID=A0ACB9FUK5_9ASTR|nr:hypothetical protein L1987_49391 [Smallanthus sonchifolius]
MGKNQVGCVRQGFYDPVKVVGSGKDYKRTGGGGEFKILKKVANGSGNLVGTEVPKSDDKDVKLAKLSDGLSTKPHIDNNAKSPDHLTKRVECEVKEVDENPDSKEFLEFFYRHAYPSPLSLLDCSLSSSLDDLEYLALIARDLTFSFLTLEISSSFSMIISWTLRQSQAVNMICLLVDFITQHRLLQKKHANLPTRDEILQQRYSGIYHELICMSENAFMTLCNILKRDGGLLPTQRMFVEEHVPRFLHIGGNDLRNQFAS